MVLVASFELVLFLLLTVGFFTLLERKILGYLQLRKGPNKVSMMGILQPISDALKLLCKEKGGIKSLTSGGWWGAPLLMLFITFSLWQISGVSCSFLSYKFSLGMILCISSLSVYSVLGAGWFSNSKYALLGALRSVAQTISYEIVMIIILMGFFLNLESLELSENSKNFCIVLLSVMNPIFFILWLVTITAETNRAPFDFAEGESEIVSGFNIEYGSFEFAMLFMAEYGSIMYFSFLSCVMFFLQSSTSVMVVLTMGFSSLIIMVRGAYPRLRYDQLMGLSWKSFLSLTLFLVVLTVSLM